MAIKKLLLIMSEKNRLMPVYIILLSIATLLSSVGLFAFSSYLIALCALHPAMSTIMVIVVVVRFFGISRAAFRYCERLISHSMTFQLIKQLRVWMYHQMVRVPFVKLLSLDSRKGLTHIIDDIERIQEFYLKTFSPFITAFCLWVAGAILFSFFGEPFIVVFIFFYGIALLVAPIVIYAMSKGLYRKREIELAIMKEKRLSMMQFSVEIKLNNQENNELLAITSSEERVEEIEKKIATVKMLGNALIQMSAHLTLFFTLLAGTLMVVNGSLQGVYLPMLTLVAFVFFESVQGNSEVIHKVELSNYSAKIIEELEGDEHSQEENFRSVNSVDLRGVTYYYPEESRAALRSINFSFQQGEKIAIVGESGSGKSTLAMMLLGLIDPTSGTIIFDKTVTREVGERSDITYVPQKNYFFHTTIKNNLTLGDDLLNEEILKVLKLCGLASWLENNREGIERMTTGNGSELSGGEKQRFALARALLHSSPLMVLDEFSSAFDPYLEKTLLRELLEHRKEQGIVYITHRLHAMNHFDKIVVMQHGAIVEEGSHEELLKNSTVYASMYQLQTSWI